MQPSDHQPSLENMLRWMRYWGKTDQSSKVDVPPYHLLVYHNLDVAAAAWTILEKNSHLKQKLGECLSIREERIVPFVAALLALHDVGKFSERFQDLQPKLFKKLQGDRTAKEYTGPRHDTLGYLLWRDYLNEKCIEDDWFSINKLKVGGKGNDANETMDVDDWWDYFDPIVQAVTGHHGAPPDYRNYHARRYFDADALADTIAYAEAIIAFFDERYGLKQPFRPWNYHEAVPRAQQGSWLLAGLAVLADWIGSNAGTNVKKHYFQFKEDADDDLESYWDTALEQARKAVERVGILPVKPSSDTGLQVLFPKLKKINAQPTSLQEYAQTCQVSSEPQLFIFEDATGSGKTEAAIILMHRILQVGGGQGAYFGLPTMATANAIFGRLIDPEGKEHPYQKLFEQPDKASLVLAHSRRSHQASFRDLNLTDADADEVYPKPEKEDEPELTGQAQCAAWIADSRKKALLAHVGVGTIDQALIGVLPSKHQSLRLLGLGTKVLIVDEVHAYDEYVSALLQDLLAFQAAMGGSAIILTATLTQRLRRDLCEAFRRGLYKPHKFEGWRNAGRLSLKETAFPLVTRLSHDNRDQAEEIPIDPRPGSERSVEVKFFHKVEDVQAYLLEKTRAGRCACWIRNTVDDAIEAFHALKDEPDVEVTLFHARFALSDRLAIEENVLRWFGEDSTHEDRKGRILIATQVVEQSLDLDFDVLVSDLAPIDLLIQREGRQHRHRRDVSGNRIADDAKDAREQPVFYVLTPALVEEVKQLTDKGEETTQTKERAPEQWLQDYHALFPKAKYVYPHTGWLWRTAKVLHELKRIAIPEEARLLLETVYAPDAPNRDELPHEWHDRAGDWAIPEALRKASNEAFNKMKQARARANHNALHLQGGYGSLKSGGRHWFDDIRTPTRLGEPTTTVRLAKLEKERAGDEEAGYRVIPWSMESIAKYQGLLDAVDIAKEAAETGGEDEMKELRSARSALLEAWQQSEVSVRMHKLASGTVWETWLKAKENEKKRQGEAVRCALKEMPDRGKWSSVVMLEQQADGTWKGEGIALKRENKGQVKEVAVTVTYSQEFGLQTQ